MQVFALVSFSAAALAYGGMTAMLLMSRPTSRRARWLLVASAATTVWAGALSLLLLTGGPSLGTIVALDAGHSFVWTACVVSWFAPTPLNAVPRAGRWLLGASAAIGLWVLFAAVAPAAGFAKQSVYPALLLMTLIGFLAIEQVFRTDDRASRRALAWLGFAVGGVFAVDLFAYSHATLANGLTAAVWGTRGLVNAALVPLLLLATKRQPEWERELFVSRRIAFYSASVIGVGCYLLSMAVVAYVIRALGGQWALGLQIVFLFAAVALLFAVLLSADIKARFKVFLVKHFYRNKYDYREEWLRLTDALGVSGETRALAASALRGIARIIGSERGELWLAREHPGPYVWTASLTPEADATPDEAYAEDHPLVRFLATRGWVVDSAQYALEPGRYDGAFGDPAAGALPANAVVVPLDCRGSLLGFVVLERRRELDAFDFEDHDILKTAGRQVATVLAQALAQEQLAETRQFEAMNKLSTFLMHDLKNAITQQELVVVNAQRFSHRPEFVDDAMETIRSAVERMKHVLEQLKGSPDALPATHRANVTQVLREVATRCAGHRPVVRMDASAAPIWASIEREKLTSALTHLVRNAQDATPPDGSVDVDLAQDGERLSISVIDTGCGMDRAFIRERLFRPFDSTKGAKGMGIGAYQAREDIRAAGGDLRVTSEPGAGTRVLITIPLTIGSRAWAPVDESAA